MNARLDALWFWPWLACLLLHTLLNKRWTAKLLDRVERF